MVGRSRALQNSFRSLDFANCGDYVRPIGQCVSQQRVNVLGGGRGKVLLGTVRDADPRVGWNTKRSDEVGIGRTLVPGSFRQIEAGLGRLPLCLGDHHYGSKAVLTSRLCGVLHRFSRLQRLTSGFQATACTAERKVGSTNGKDEFL